jgi:hypothetical protein
MIFAISGQGYLPIRSVKDQEAILAQVQASALGIEPVCRSEAEA